MRIALITIPPIERKIAFDLDKEMKCAYDISLGILSLAAILEKSGLKAEIICLYKLVEKKFLKCGAKFHKEVASYLTGKTSLKKLSTF